MKRFWILEGREKSIDGSVGSHEGIHQDITLVFSSVKEIGRASREQC